MIVAKTINNNIVSCFDDAGQEVIVMGRGLGFQCRPGAPIRQDLVEKVFHLDDPQQADRFKTLVSNLPPEYLQLCTKIIDYASEVLNVRLQESVYLTLTDHVCFAIQRQQQGISFHNVLEHEVRIFYPQEYAIGLHALALIRNELGILLPEDEAASIALHLVNAEWDGSLQCTLRTTQTLHDILDFLGKHPQLHLQQDDPYYDELVVVLKFLLQRCFSDEEASAPDMEFVQMVQQHFTISYDIAKTIIHQLEKLCGHPISVEETAYLAIRIRRIIHQKQN